MMIPVEHDGMQLMSFGFLLPDGPAIMRGPMVSGYLQQILTQTEWNQLDYLIVDMPPGTGDVQLTMTQTINLTGAVIVTTRQSLSLSDVERGILMFEKVNVPMLGLVENMSWFDCGKCGERHFLFGGNTDTGLGDRYGLSTLAQIPINPQWGARPDLADESPLITEMVDNMIRSQGTVSLNSNERPEVSHDRESFTCVWPNGSTTVTDHYTLRVNCPCAVCVDEYTGEKKLDAASVPKDIEPESFEMLGNYALHIRWNDGHGSGIFPFKLIKELARETR